MITIRTNAISGLICQASSPHPIAQPLMAQEFLKLAAKITANFVVMLWGHVRQSPTGGRYCTTTNI